MNFAERALNCGGLIRPLIIPAELNSGLGLMNPSILIHNQKIKTRKKKNCKDLIFLEKSKKLKKA